LAKQTKKQAMKVNLTPAQVKALEKMTGTKVKSAKKKVKASKAQMDWRKKFAEMSKSGKMKSPGRPKKSKS
jgi:hypothetical protein